MTKDASNDTGRDWGEVYVTRKCCGAANCRNFAPQLFAEVGSPGVLADSYEEGAFTGLVRQPQSAEDYAAARAAAAGCGFAAIKLRKPKQKLPPEAQGAPWRDWPRRLEDNVWVIGQPSRKNYGALSYFIELEGGGVLVDLPKPSDALFQWLEEHGGVRWIFLTHRDHVQHHAEYAARFPDARRVIGAADVNKRQNAFADATGAVEVKLPNDPTPRELDGTPLPLERLSTAELAVLPQPGHTPGGLCLLYAGRFLFTGDHLAYSRKLGHLIGHRLQCWQDWGRLTASVEQLVAWSRDNGMAFRWVLPGHGEWVRFEGDGSAAATLAELNRGLEWMREQPAGNVPLIRWIPFFMSRAKPEGRLARVVLALGGKRRDAWLIPAAARQYLPDHRAGA